jgi:hypothetical protein
LQTLTLRPPADPEQDHREHRRQVGQRDSGGEAGQRSDIVPGARGDQRPETELLDEQRGRDHRAATHTEGALGRTIEAPRQQQRAALHVDRPQQHAEQHGNEQQPRAVHAKHTRADAGRDEDDRRQLEKQQCDAASRVTQGVQRGVEDDAQRKLLGNGPAIRHVM